MKKFSTIIIALCIIFASVNNVLAVSKANKGLFDEILNLDLGPEIFELNAIQLESRYFQSETLRNTYDNFIKIDALFKDLAIKAYQDGKIADYELNGLINTYSSFIYAGNQLFFKIELLDLGLDGSKELTDGIKKDYIQVRSYYEKLDQIINKK